MGPDFVTIDFETGDWYRDSACAVALVRVRGGRIAERRHTLLRPPRPIRDENARLHGITNARVWTAPTFAEAWPTLRPLLDGAAFLAAHNAPFDRSVLKRCCEDAGLAVPALPVVCTVRAAKAAWGLKSARLPEVCRLLDVRLRHHDPASDAEACAQIVLALLAGGARLAA